MQHTIARTAGTAGGLAWLVRLGLDLAGALGAATSDVLWWVGAVLLVVAVLDVGLGLVPRAPGWLRAVVAVGSVSLAASVVAVLHGGGDGVTVDGALGVLAVAVFGSRLVAGLRREARARTAERAAAEVSAASAEAASRSAGSGSSPAPGAPPGTPGAPAPGRRAAPTGKRRSAGAHAR